MAKYSLPPPPKLPPIKTPRLPLGRWERPTGLPPEPYPEPKTPGYMYPLKALQFIDESIYNAVAEYYKRKDPQKYGDLGTPYEEVRDTIRAMMVGYGGADPEGAAVRWGGRVGGFVGSMPLSLLAWLGTPAAKAGRAGGGVVAKTLTAPIRAGTYPISLLKAGLVEPATAAVRGMPALAWLAKSHSVAAGIKWPFKAVAARISAAADGTGLLTPAAKSIRAGAIAIRDAFGIGGPLKTLAMPVARVTAADMTHYAYFDDFATAWKAGKVDRAAPLLGKLSQLRPIPLREAAGELRPTGILARMFRRGGVAVFKRGLAEAHAASMGAPDELLMRLAEMPSSKAMKDALRALPGVSKDTKVMLMGLVEHIRFLGERSMNSGLRAQQLFYTMQKAAVPPETRQALAQEIARRTRPLGIKDLYRIVHPGKARQAELFPHRGAMPQGLKDFPVALESPRIGYAARRAFPTALDEMTKKQLWEPFKAEAVRMLKATDTLPETMVDDIVAEAMRTPLKVTRKTFAKEFARAPWARHLTAAELNQAAWNVGLDKNVQLFTTGFLEAAIPHGAFRTKQLLMMRTIQAAIEAAATDTKTLNILQQTGIDKLTPKVLDRYSVAAYKGMEHTLRKGAGVLKDYDLLLNRASGEWMPITRSLGRAVHNNYEIFHNPKVMYPISGFLLRMYDQLLGMNKHIALNYSFGYMSRNMMDDTVRMMVANGASDTLDGLMGAWRLERGRTMTIIAKDGKKLVLTRGLADRYVIASGKEAEAVVEAGAGAFSGITGGTFRGKMHKVSLMRVNNFLENFRSRAQFIASVKRHAVDRPLGEAIRAAMADVREVLYAYSEGTRFERAVPGRIIFFYRFMRKNIPFHIKMMASKPFHQYLAIVGPQRLFGETADPLDAFMPEWIRERGGFRIGDSKDGEVTYTAGMGLSQWEAFSKILPGRLRTEWLSSLAQPITMPLELLAGKRFFIERDIRDINRLHSPPVAKALSLVNPLWERLYDKKLIRRAEYRDKEYWIVPGHLMWAISQLRPLNDLTKALDSRRDTGELLIWAGTGMQSRKFSEDQLKDPWIRKQLREGIEELSEMGLLRELRIPYMAKGVEMTPKEKERGLAVIRQQRAMAKRGRTPKKRRRKW